MLLVILLATLVLGIGCVMAVRLWEYVRDFRPAQVPPVLSHRRLRSRIEQDLDHLLLLYRQGLLDEIQYHRLADELIDQLATVLEKESVPAEV
ncbi:hypothetical protein [Tellurirhabdus rosea]|uniref:hypothetical protein n=1 Tax=Tellurirhabdus rosea TaxID=2674997 RepID=UPI00225A415A|nr:hypothetical protein [Tellurirhabdus rosea]